MHKSRHILVLCCLAVLLSCRPEPLSLNGRPHFWHPSPTGENALWPGGDTVVSVCTIRYPAGYDWLSDSSALREGCQVRVYANGKQVLSLETGAASGLQPDGDTHHLSGGHLLSEGFRNGETLLLRDGEVLLQFEGWEKLCGYLCAEGHHYSLWRDRDGNGFTLRKDGTVLQRRENGWPMGDFGDADRSGGALSFTGGTACFAYCLPVGDQTGCFLSLGGSEMLLYKGSGLQFLDARLLEGRTWTLYRDRDGATWLTDGMEKHDFNWYGLLRWQEARIVAWEDGPALLGSALIRGETTPLQLLSALNGDLFGAGKGLCFPIGKNTEYVVSYDGDHRLTLRGGLSRTDTAGGTVLWESGESVFFSSGNCASVLGERVFLGITPRSGGKSYLWSGRKLGEWTLNGYICAVEAFLSPPNGGS